jgi:hypothetical protein
MSTSETKHQRHLVKIASESPWFMDALVAVRQLELAEWCIGAGAIRNLVWDSLHGKSSPSQLSDVDVAYFDISDTSTRRDKELQGKLQALDPRFHWEVTNQAGVHQWFEEYFGHAVEPLHSLEEAVASWPEFATAIGISLGRDNSLQIIAPHGLKDPWLCAATQRA